MSTRGFPVTAQRRAARRAQAEVRQAEYDKLSIQDKLDRLPADRCNRQRTKLMAQVQKLADKKEKERAANEAAAIAKAAKAEAADKKNKK